MKTIDHKFVEFIPEQEDMEGGVIYISLEYDTAVHSCLCGCGHQVITPLSPIDWKLTYNGESLSLHPSIGNWEFNCRSHYWIKQGRVIWDETWSGQRVSRVREADISAKKKYYNQSDKAQDRNLSWLQSLKRLFFGK